MQKRIAIIEKNKNIDKEIELEKLKNEQEKKSIL